MWLNFMVLYWNKFLKLAAGLLRNWNKHFWKTISSLFLDGLATSYPEWFRVNKKLDVWFLYKTGALDLTSNTHIWNPSQNRFFVSQRSQIYVLQECLVLIRSLKWVFRFSDHKHVHGSFHPLLQMVHLYFDKVSWRFLIFFPFYHSKTDIIDKSIHVFYF